MLCIAAPFHDQLTCVKRGESPKTGNSNSLLRGSAPFAPRKGSPHNFRSEITALRLPELPAPVGDTPPLAACDPAFARRRSAFGFQTPRFTRSNNHNKGDNPTRLFLQKLTEITPELVTHVERTIKIENAPWMTLTVENIGLGPRGLPALSICHYGEHNGDLMRDPEICFEMEIEGGKVKEFHPYYWRNDYVGFEQVAVMHGHDEHRPIIDLHMPRGQRNFAATWDRNLEAQGFLRGYRDAKA